MRKMMILCDRCGKEIDGNPIRIMPTGTNRETGDILGDYLRDKFYGRDYCTDCTDRIMEVALEDAKGQQADEGQKQDEPEPDEVKEDQDVTAKEEQGKKDKKSLDVGKIMALKKAGWTNVQIADEMGATPGTIAVYISKARKGGKI